VGGQGACEAGDLVCGVVGARASGAGGGDRRSLHIRGRGLDGRAGGAQADRREHAGDVPRQSSRRRGAGGIEDADPGASAAGKYGQEALERLGVWAQVAPRVVRAENVRATLALVERGAAPLGIVYATDAKASAQVRIAGVFPASTHPAITYPVARLSTSRNPEAEAFRRFLVSRGGKAIFVRYGFSAR